MKKEAPPNALETEKAFLGALMVRPEAMSESIDAITTDAFYAEKHKTIYKVMLELFSKGDPVDIETVRGKLESAGTLRQIGGMAYLATLAAEVPAPSNARHYATQIQHKSTLRNLIAAGERVTSLGHDEVSELDSILDKAEKSVYEISAGVTMTKFTQLGDSLGTTWERFVEMRTGVDKAGIMTGFKDLDTLLAGLHKSDLIILAARPSVGKTALALDIARQAAVQYGTVVGIFSLEMATQQLVDRMIAAEAKVSAWNWRTGKIREGTQEFKRVHEAYERLSAAPIFIEDTPGNNILKMRSVCRRLKKDKGLGLVIVDYLQLMAPTEAKGSDSLVHQITEISRSLKILARELEVPVLALSQLNRSVEQRRGKPRLSDLRDSGSIEQDADVVMFIHREDKMNEDSSKTNIAEILVEKHRNGPVGKVELYFDDTQTTFRDLETRSVPSTVLENF